MLVIWFILVVLALIKIYGLLPQDANVLAALFGPGPGLAQGFAFRELASLATSCLVRPQTQHMHRSQNQYDRGQIRDRAVLAIPFQESAVVSLNVFAIGSHPARQKAKLTYGGEADLGHSIGAGLLLCPGSGAMVPAGTKRFKPPNQERLAPKVA
ncbi:hypothetical protein EV356DRAFT_518260 [Viridothelium virens]|uniref:Uncharacterized protein n=1 Tax=Viridothelium virens TaxID=1048519 RepID=A0A6A6H1I5_VIRVR|nr:hypothetical protein EV356DRAFT_518260 [Viridothelium virens]